MQSAGRVIRQWALPLVVALAALILQVTDGFEWIRLERDTALVEPWRLLGAHFVHLGWIHLGMNLAGLAVLWMLLGDTIRPVLWASGVLFIAFGVSLGLLCCSPAVTWYVGFSGVLHGLFVAGAVANIRRLPALGAVLVIALTAKIVLEQVGGGDSLTQGLIGDAVIVDAHLYGAVAGVCYGMLLLALSSRIA
ncbi:MAG: rhombosortase [Thioalkalivibrio sp.]|nr:rhombosortase [Thioalkalivibrio sp.]